MADGEGTPTKCICKPITCRNTGELCHKSDCTTCKACCDSECDGCEKKCTPGQKCKCYIPRCGCKDDCYEKDSNGTCKGKVTGGSCERCKEKCKSGKPCICYQCSCGPRCNGVICSCCSWCDPRNCSGKKCNGYVLGRCDGEGPCKGHVRYDRDGAVWDLKQAPIIKCDESHTDCSVERCNKWATGVRDNNGNCVKICTYCGKLCGQDNFRRCCTIALPLVIIVLLFLIFRFMLPEKFHGMMTRIRAAFPISSRRPSSPLNTLVGNTIPGEVDIHRYPAFRPRAYAGLA